MKKILLYKSGFTRATGRMLANELGVRTQINDAHRNDYKLIRWGNSESVRFAPSDTLNSKDALLKSVNKMNALKIMSDAGVNTPQMFTRADDVNTFPVIGRMRSHQGGSGFKYISSRSELAANSNYDYYLKYLPVEREYRIHVFRDEILAISKKQEKEDFEGVRDHVCRNIAGGWYFSLCDANRVREDIRQIGIDSVRGLGLDFGAVDVIIHDNVPYVLEVNSAPGLDENGTIKNKYIEKFNNWYTGTTERQTDTPQENDISDELINKLRTKSTKEKLSFIMRAIKSAMEE